jgi:hypothetical protein
MTTSSNGGPLTYVPAPNEQHMLFLFFPLFKGALKEAFEHVGGLVSRSVKTPVPTAPARDDRTDTGVHFAFFYGVPDCDPKIEKCPPPPLWPTFTNTPGKDLLVIQAIYDADFLPYIGAFTSQPSIAAGLDGVLSLMDESGIVPDTDPTSAKFILSHGGVYKNALPFVNLLMRYNFSDPTIPATTGAGINPVAHPKFLFVGTFPGLTVGKILQNYPDAQTLWPSPAVPVTFDLST